MWNRFDKPGSDGHYNYAKEMKKWETGNNSVRIPFYTCGWRSIPHMAESYHPSLKLSWKFSFRIQSN